MAKLGILGETMICPHCTKDTTEKILVDGYRTNNTFDAKSEPPVVIVKKDSPFLKNAKNALANLATLALCLAFIASICFTLTVFITYVGHLVHYSLYHDTFYSQATVGTQNMNAWIGWMVGFGTLAGIFVAIVMAIAIFVFLKNIFIGKNSALKDIQRNLFRNLSDLW